MYCGNCGSEVADDSAFCGNCGMSVSGAATTAPETDVSRSEGKAKVATALNIVAIVLYAAAAIDFVSGRIFGIDLTGVFWSPIALGAVGGALSTVAKKMSGEEDDETQEKKETN